MKTSVSLVALSAALLAASPLAQAQSAVKWTSFDSVSNTALGTLTSGTDILNVTATVVGGTGIKAVGTGGHYLAIWEDAANITLTLTFAGVVQNAGFYMANISSNAGSGVNASTITMSQDFLATGTTGNVASQDQPTGSSKTPSASGNANILLRGGVNGVFPAGGTYVEGNTYNGIQSTNGGGANAFDNQQMYGAGNFVNAVTNSVTFTYSRGPSGVGATSYFQFDGTVAPVAAVPEPASWLLLAAGVGALGLLARRNKRKA